MKKFKPDTKYLHLGLTAFLVIVAAVLFAGFVNNISYFRELLRSVLRILSPFIWGIAIAYLLWPLVNRLHKSVFTSLGRKIWKKNDSEKTVFRFARGMAVAVSVILMVLLVIACIWLIAPRLLQSLQSILTNSRDYMFTAYDWINRLLVGFPEVREMLSEALGNVSNSVIDWINRILPFLGNLTTILTTFVKGIYNVFIGVIVSVYLLYSKELAVAFLRKILYCIFSLETAAKIVKTVEFIDQVFIGFITGKILDSLIIGCICYVACLIMKMPYALLVSFIIGITNLIPFFGPFIGAIPSTIIILMEAPVKSLVFLIFILILQQFDGNVLGPKILGNSVGMNGFWILFSIILGAGLFGFVGMLLGVPVFTVLYTGVTALVNRKLRRSGLPTENSFYRELDYIDPATGEAVKRTENVRRTGSKQHPWMQKGSRKEKTPSPERDGEQTENEN